MFLTFHSYRTCCDAHQQRGLQSKPFTSKSFHFQLSLQLVFLFPPILWEKKSLYLFFIHGSMGIEIEEYRNLTRSLSLTAGCTGTGPRPLSPPSPDAGQRGALAPRKVPSPRGPGLRRLPRRLPAETQRGKLGGKLAPASPRQ